MGESGDMKAPSLCNSEKGLNGRMAIVFIFNHTVVVFWFLSRHWPVCGVIAFGELALHCIPMGFLGGYSLWMNEILPRYGTIIEAKALNL